MNEVNEAITLLPDESLGGLTREYNEVKRKALVGELVKSIVDDPPVFTVTEVTGGQGAVYGGADGVPTHAENYVILEPSDIIYVDDKDGVSRKYRMVERKAAVGERVVVVAIRKKFREDETLAVGQTGVCTEIISYGENAIDTTLTHNKTGFLNPHRVTYRVLEPLTDVIPTQTTRNKPQLSALDPVDQYADNIARLITKVQALEERLTALESASNAKVASGPINVALPSFAKKTAQQIRDEIVARAKADVKKLLNRNYSILDGYSPSIWFTNNAGAYVTDKCDFIVNKEKRTVVALISEIDGNVFRKGSAKAAPGEVFNVHIGKAIALHRALGLVVPAEYMNVPAPTEIRAGDIVEGGKVLAVRPTHSRGGGVYISADKGYTYINSRGHEWWALIEEAVILDDSREESEGVNA